MCGEDFHMNHMGMELHKAAFLYGAIFSLANRMQTLGDRMDSEVSTKQWFVLACVAMFNNNTPNIGDVAGILGTSRQNIKKIATILEKKGYLTMQKDQNDKRSIQLILTDNCYEYFRNREQLENEYEKKIFSGIDDRMTDSLYEGLGKLVENIDSLINNE